MALLVLLITTLTGLIPGALANNLVGLCSQSFCACSPAAHPSWTIVNCTVPEDQTMDIMEGDLPESTTDLIVSGGQALMFGANSLSRLKDARQIYVSGTKIVVIRKYAAVNLNVISVYLQIENCDVLRIEGKAFSKIKGPLSTTIKQCDYISMEGEAFSWLLTMSISNVKKLELSRGAFMLDPTAANVGEHGPGMTIELRNMTIPELASQTFGSSAAAISLEFVEVHAISAAAFSANTYSNVTAANCSFHLIESNAFAQKTLIDNLLFYGCVVHQLDTGALQSAVTNLNISYSRFKHVMGGAINATVANVVILDSKFNTFTERGFELSSWNKLQMERNSFDELASQAIVAPAASMHELIFADNEIETADPQSLEFIGQAYATAPSSVLYKKNYYGQQCRCDIRPWVADVLHTEYGDHFLSETYCTVDEFFARCYNVHDQNMESKKFIDSVCNDDVTLKCEPFQSKIKGEVTEIKNPRFPHKKDEEKLSERDKKVIGIVIVTALGCVVIVMFISLVRWMRNKGYCVNVKNFLISSNSSCGSLCDRLCVCGANSGLDNARSISQLSVNEYSERHRLNEPRVQDITQETILPDVYSEQTVTEDKTTQTLPEELTKELLENLREKLDDPENYVEAREMIEHLYDLIKVEESCNANTPTLMYTDENIYELPFQNTTPRIGKNKKQMISIGTRAPSLDKLLPLSPYNRQTALVHEYFEPKDFAVHLYAEIVNSDRDKKALMNAMPDIVAEQAMPRGPYLRAVRDKLNSSANSSPSIKSLSSSLASPQYTSTTKSNKSTTSNSSGNMLNRPLPEKPVTDPGEGTSSFQHG